MLDVSDYVYVHKIFQFLPLFSEKIFLLKGVYMANECEHSTNIPVYMQRVFRVSLCSGGNGNHKISGGSEVNQRGENH